MSQEFAYDEFALMDWIANYIPRKNLIDFLKKLKVSDAHKATEETII